MFKIFSSIKIFSLDTYASRNSNTEWLEFFNSINFSDFKLIVLIKANAKNNTKNTCIMGMLISKCQRQEFLIGVRQVLTYLIQADWFIMFIIHFNL